MQYLNFNTNTMIRLASMPTVQITITQPTTLQRTPKGPNGTAIPIGGVGELGVPMFAPALANAYFKSTGTRKRTLPFFP